MVETRRVPAARESLVEQNLAEIHEHQQNGDGKETVADEADHETRDLDRMSC